MKKMLSTILAVVLLAGQASDLRAADDVVLVELFTSQGCSSCPPADENLAGLTGMAGVLPLSLHVDYWDYLGWRDTFAQRKHSERQFAYRDLMGARVVYTPQMIVHGTRDIPGYRPKEVRAAIAAVTDGARGASIRITDQDGMLKARLAGSNDQNKATIYMATYTGEATVAIARGENAGRNITYHNVVKELMSVGPWQGGPEREIALPRPDTGEGIAVWIQDRATGRILAASYFEGG